MPAERGQQLPPVAPFPRSSFRQHLSPQDWDVLVDAWIAVAGVWLSLPDAEFASQLEASSSSRASDEAASSGSASASVAAFVVSLVEEVAEHGSSIIETSSSTKVKTLFNGAYRLANRLIPIILSSSATSATAKSNSALVSYPFVRQLSAVYSKHLSTPLIQQIVASRPEALDASLSPFKKTLTSELEGIASSQTSKSRPEEHVANRLLRLAPLLRASPHVAAFFLAGDDFSDALLSAFRVTPPSTSSSSSLRSAIVAVYYLCVVGLAQSDDGTSPARWSMLSDRLYALKAAAPTEPLIPELVSTTPLLEVLSTRVVDGHSGSSDSLRSRIAALEAFRRDGVVPIRPRTKSRRKKRSVDKGKGKITADEVDAEMHIHKMSQITQVQDLFPDLGAGFVSKCLDEYGEDVEQVVANLLSETLPLHLANADRSEPLSTHSDHKHPDLAPRPTPPLPPTRRNIYDDDEFDRLTADVSKISFGKKPARTADEVLQDRSTAPGKAAILSALAAFDSDDDERDDTYDADDVGGTVDSTNQEADGVSDGTEEALFRAYQMDDRVFGRDAPTRRGPARSRLREETGMTDESIEGWALMLARNPQQKRRLEAKYAFSGQQAQLESTAWRASPAVSGAEDSDRDTGGPSRGGKGRGRGRGRGQGRGGNVAGATGEKETEAARRNKESHKSSRANHSRRDQHARKMARGGFAG